jgi:hypothetical protein
MGNEETELGDFEAQHDSGTDIEADQLIERTDTGVSITTELKRGSGTRDQDKHTLKAKGHSLNDAIEKHQKGMAYLEAEVLDDARQMQPEIEEGDENGD